MPPPLDPSLLYVSPKGRVFCGARACTGSVAAVSGKEEVAEAAPVTEDFAETWFLAIGEPVACQCCGKRRAGTPLRSTR